MGYLFYLFIYFW